MNRNSCLPNFWVIALCFFSYINFVWCISPRLCMLWLWNFVDGRSHQGGVHCTWTLTLACLSFELLPFFIIHTWFLSGAYLQNYISYGYEILWVNRSHQGGVQCTWTLALACLILELLPFVYFHTWILSGAYLQDYTSYGYEISWMVTTWGKTGTFCDNLPLLFNIEFALNPFPNKPWFLCICITSLLKTLWEKKKLLVMRISPFPQCFLPIWSTFLPFSSDLELSSVKSFSLEESKFVVGYGLLPFL